MAESIDYSKLVTKINSVLEMKRKIVGLRFIFTEKDFNKIDIPTSKKKMSYCRMVKEASEGKNIKSNFDNFACFAGARALGIVEAGQKYKSGKYYDGCGLYQDLATAKEVTKKITICEHKVYGIEVKPLENFSQKADLVLIISEAFNAMRLIQGYTHKCGAYSSFKMIGNQAICSECTAYPYETNQLNFSLLCAGARKNGFAKTEVGIGITENKFRKMAAGLFATVNPVENNQNKKVIEQKLKANNIFDLEIIYNQNYGDQLRNYDLEEFLK